MMFRALVRRLLHRGPGQPGTRIAPYRELVRGLTHWAKSGVHPAGAGESDLWERLAALTAKRRQDIIALSLEDVLARHPERVVDEMFDRISEKAETGLELRPKEQAMAALLMLQGEVNNGGFHQYFLNPGGRYAQEALAGAEMLGFESLTTLVQEAMGRFAGGRPPEDRACGS